MSKLSKLDGSKADRVRQYLSNNFKTLEQAGKHFGFSHSTMSRLQTGVQTPTAWIDKAISENNVDVYSKIK
ncbi:helix-turn-helix domain-containing protein [bacterium]|nr:helix-turn-helix domain-containing protein [bacterium]